MDYNDRELFVYQIISGTVKIKHGDKTIKILPPTTEVYLEACEKYSEVFHMSYTRDDIKDMEEMVNWMVEQGLWDFFKSKELDGANKKLDDLKVLCYENRGNTRLLNTHRLNLRISEKRIEDLNREKNVYYAQTANGLAASAKMSYIIENSTYCDGKLYNFEDVTLESVTMDYNRFHNIEESVLRELARNEPWRSKWILREGINRPLFLHEDRELTLNQKSLLTWSRMYDNVHESMESPEDYVVEDDDLLDGWFIHQNRKRDREKAEQDMNSSIKNSKITNSEEVFKVVNNVEDFNRVESMNNPIAAMHKKQRAAKIKRDKAVNQHELPDQQQKIQMQATNQMKGKFKNG